MTIKRKLVKVQAPAAQPGFLGAGHKARAVIQTPYDESDPFILLMDDVLDKVDDEPAGGPILTQDLKPFHLCWKAKWVTRRIK